MDWLEELCSRSKLSIFLGAAVLIVSAAMMQPGFATLFALLIEVALLVLMRAVAKIEGRNE